jgi:hypothetical protein
MAGGPRAGLGFTLRLSFAFQRVPETAREQQQLRSIGINPRSADVGIDSCLAVAKVTK